MSEFTKMDVSFSPDKDSCTVLISYSNGTMEQKEISISDFLYMMRDSSVKEEYRIGELPMGYVDAKVDTNSNDFRIILTTEAGIYPVQYMNEPLKLIPFPKLAFYLKLEGGKVVSSKCFALKGQALCYYPFGNVYENGNICWGGYSFTGIDSLKKAELVTRKFFELGTNSDLWSRRYINADYAVLSQFYNHLAGLDVFPEEYLKPRGCTINDLITEFMC